MLDLCTPARLELYEGVTVSAVLIQAFPVVSWAGLTFLLEKVMSICPGECL